MTWEWAYWLDCQRAGPLGPALYTRYIWKDRKASPKAACPFFPIPNSHFIASKADAFSIVPSCDFPSDDWSNFGFEITDLMHTKIGWSFSRNFSGLATWCRRTELTHRTENKWCLCGNDEQHRTHGARTIEKSISRACIARDLMGNLKIAVMSARVICLSLSHTDGTKLASDPSKVPIFGKKNLWSDTLRAFILRGHCGPEHLQAASAHIMHSQGMYWGSPSAP